MAEIAPGDRLLLMDEVAEITRQSRDTLRYLRSRGEGPPSFRLGRRVVYPEGPLRAWISEQARQDASSVGIAASVGASVALESHSRKRAARRSATAGA